jgi:hypothetical protein
MHQTKNKYVRPKGWFNERCVGILPVSVPKFSVSQGGNDYGQQVRCRNIRRMKSEPIFFYRVLRDDPSKSDMHNREGLSLRRIFEALKDWRLWPLYCLGLVHMSELILLSRRIPVNNEIIVPTGPPQVSLQ